MVSSKRQLKGRKASLLDHKQTMFILQQAGMFKLQNSMVQHVRALHLELNKQPVNKKENRTPESIADLSKDGLNNQIADRFMAPE